MPAPLPSGQYQRVALLAVCEHAPVPLTPPGLSYTQAAPPAAPQPVFGNAWHAA